VGIPLAVVGANPSAVVEVGSTTIVEGSQGFVLTTVVTGGMLVTPASLVLAEELVVLVAVELRSVVVGGKIVVVGVSGGKVEF
jgi:hypothetical protein